MIENYFQYLNDEIEIRIESIKIEIDKQCSSLENKVNRFKSYLLKCKHNNQIESSSTVFNVNTKKYVKIINIGYLTDNFISLNNLKYFEPKIFYFNDFNSIIHMCRISNDKLAFIEKYGSNEETSILVINSSFQITNYIKEIKNKKFSSSILCSSVNTTVSGVFTDDEDMYTEHVVFLCDINESKINITNENFMQINSTFGTQNQFSFITDINFLNNEFYIFDQLNKSIQMYTVDGQLIKKYHLFKVFDSQSQFFDIDFNSDAFLIDYPKAITISNTHIAVIANGYNIIYIYDNECNLKQIIYDNHDERYCSMLFHKCYLFIHSSKGFLLVYEYDNKENLYKFLIKTKFNQELKLFSYKMTVFNENLLIILLSNNTLALFKL